MMAFWAGFSSRPSSQPSGRAVFLGVPARPAGPFGIRTGVRRGGIEFRQEPAEHLQGGHSGQLSPQLSPYDVALEVPGHVLADVPQGDDFVPEGFHQELGMPVDAVCDFLQSGAVPFIAAFEGGLQVCEEPRAALAAAANDDAVHTGLLDHGNGVFGGPDISVAQHRHVRERFAQLGDGVPVGLAGIELRGGAAVQGHCCHTGVAGNLAGLAESEVVLVDALAHLDGQRDLALGGLPDRGLDNCRKQVQLPGQCRAAALAGDLGNRAAEVQVDVVCPVFLDEHPDGCADCYRVHTVELDGTDGLVVIMLDDAQ